MKKVIFIFLLLIAFVVLYLKYGGQKDVLINLKDDKDLIERFNNNYYAVFEIDTISEGFSLFLKMIPDTCLDCIYSKKYVKLSNGDLIHIIDIEAFYNCADVVITGGSLEVKVLETGSVISILDLQ
jgi:hypothetical protein